MDSVARLCEFLLESRSAVAFTGAGISTESGIPDFRSPGGFWSRNTPIDFSEFVASREARVRFWKQRIEMYRDYADAQPNDGHRALARLEQIGRLMAVITQNIDGLHQIAGSRRVIELHGTARMVGCIDCGKEWAPETVHAIIEAGNDAPDCDECGAPLKSKTISFGQPMPVDAMNEAGQLCSRAELCLVVGSSLVVEPAASFPRLAKSRGARLVIINRDDTPLDYLAELIIREPIGVTLRAVLDCIEDRTPIT
jgi:NAD-dependent deacetylase